MIINASNEEAGFGKGVEITKSTSNDFDVMETFTLTVAYTSAISVNVTWDPQEGVNEYRVQYREVGECKIISYTLHNVACIILCVIFDCRLCTVCTEGVVCVIS